MTGLAFMAERRSQSWMDELELILRPMAFGNVHRTFLLYCSQKIYMKCFLWQLIRSSDRSGSCDKIKKK